MAVEQETILIGAATVSGSILGSICLVEYRLFREQKREQRKRKLKWARKAEVLTDQIERECRDIKAFDGSRRARVAGSRDEHPIFDRIQELKNLLSETPEDVAKNTEYFMRDTWVKFEMARIDTQNPDWEIIDSDVQPQVEQAHDELVAYREELEKQGLVGRLLGRPIQK